MHEDAILRRTLIQQVANRKRDAQVAIRLYREAKYIALNAGITHAELSVAEANDDADPPHLNDESDTT